MLLNDGQPRYAFRKCKPNHCSRPRNLYIPVTNDSSHTITFLELSETHNPLSACTEGYKGYMCSACADSFYRLLSSRPCKPCILQSSHSKWLGKTVSVVVLLFVLFGWVPLIRKAKRYVPSLYTLLPFFQVFTLLRTLDFDWPTIVSKLGIPLSVFAVRTFIHPPFAVLRFVWPMYAHMADQP